jgi:hypothetical protein
MKLSKKSWLRNSLIGTAVVAVMGCVGFGVYKMTSSNDEVISSASNYKQNTATLPKFANNMESSKPIERNEPKSLFTDESAHKADKHSKKVSKAKGHKSNKLVKHKSHKGKKHSIAKKHGHKSKSKFAKHHKSHGHKKFAHKKSKARGHKYAAQ